MVLDVVRGYLAVAEGLGDVARKRVMDLAGILVSSGSEAADRSGEQVTALAEDFVKQGQDNKDLLVGLIRTEIDRTVGRMGFVREEELAAVRNHVARLEAQMRSMPAGAAGAGSQAARAAASTLSGAAGAIGSKVAAPRRSGGIAAMAVVGLQPGGEAAAVAPAERAPAKKTAAARRDAEQAVPVVADLSPAEQAAVAEAAAPAAKKTPAKKAPAKKAPAKKTPAKRAPGKRAASRPAGPPAGGAGAGSGGADA